MEIGTAVVDKQRYRIQVRWLSDFPLYDIIILDDDNTIVRIGTPREQEKTEK